VTPASLGFPSWFSSFRPAQEEAIEHFLCSGSRFVGIGAPPGVGKSGVALAISELCGGRTAILTASLGLQDQYHDQFGDSMSLMDVRGRSNYSCWEGGTCEDGGRMGCTDKLGCPYLIALSAAQQAERFETSYAFWLAVERMKPVDTLILDEAGLAFDWLSRSLNFHLTKAELERVGIRGAVLKLGEDIAPWQAIASQIKLAAEIEYTALRSERSKAINDTKKRRLSQEIKVAESLFDRASRLDLMDTKNWIVTRDTESCHYDGKLIGLQWKFECVWPGAYRERLFRGVQRVVLLSATLRPKTLGLLGISKQDSDFREWTRQFPLVNGPVIHVKTARVKHSMSDEDTRIWLDRIDEIIAANPDRKGLVHSVSYARAKQIVEHSKHRHRLIFNKNDSGSPKAAAVFRDFERTAPAQGKVLVSPSFSTGWDFSGERAEFQIITKLAFPDTRSPVMSRRCSDDPTYSNYLTGQELVQACGRVQRSDTDRGTTYIIDDQVEWFMRLAKDLMPAWFKVRREVSIPERLEKL
jgi:Rad3-related DNA helicase